MVSADIFTPYYTGRIIQAIAIDKSHSKFIQAIIVMSVLSVIRYDILQVHCLVEKFEMTFK